MREKLIRKGIPVALLIGTDEAGYGPPLGPLVISATAWETSRRDVDLYQTLAEVVTNSPTADKSVSAKQRLLIADSKIACRSGAIGNLEATVLLLLDSVYGRMPKTLADLVLIVMPTVAEDFLQQHFWLKGMDVELPLSSSNGLGASYSELGARFRAACERNSIRLSDIRSTILLPPEFNALVAKFGNKASLLSDRTLRLAAGLMEGRLDDTLIECDKHGGRNYYGKMIASALTDRPVEIVQESSARSVYQWRLPNRECEIRFTAKGEGQLPVALASMVSKYVREVFMVAWNEYWGGRIPNIKPTKGYPQDAKRFLGEIKNVVKAQNISQSEFWRNC